MSAAHAPLEPHGPIEPLFDDVWRVNGSLEMKPTMRLGRNMIVVRNGGELTIINSVRLDSGTEAQLKALGTIAHVVKIGLHGMDDAYYVDTFGAKMWTLPGARVAEGVTATDVLSADGDSATPGSPVPDLTVFVFALTNKPEAALLLERHGGLLITCDSVQHWEPSPRNSFTARIAFRLMGFMHPAQIGPPWLKAQTPAGGSARGDFDRLVALPFRHVIGGHGGLLRDDGPARLAETIHRVFGS